MVAKGQCCHNEHASAKLPGRDCRPLSSARFREVRDPWANVQAVSVRARATTWCRQQLAEPAAKATKPDRWDGQVHARLVAKAYGGQRAVKWLTLLADIDKGGDLVNAASKGAETGEYIVTCAWFQVVLDKWAST